MCTDGQVAGHDLVICLVMSNPEHVSMLLPHVKDVYMDIPEHFN